MQYSMSATMRIRSQRDWAVVSQDFFCHGFDGSGSDGTSHVHTHTRTHVLVHTQTCARARTK